MGTIDQETLNAVRTGVDIVDVVGNYIPLIQRGKNYFGVCPFHDDSHPSMSVSKEKQIYTCFSCGATGNVFKFLMDYQNISFPEAVKMCADMVGIPLELSIHKKKDNYTEFRELYDIYDLSSKFYQNNINTSVGKEARDYLFQREIDDAVIKEFGIGLSLKDRDLLTKLLLKKDFKKEDLLRSGLVLESSYGIHDIYYNRIMFPIENLTGKVVGFSGRVYEGDDQAKYINTRETDIFKKGEILYNYTRAKDEARLKGFVIVMEGFMDVIRAYTIGIKNVVATMGTAVTKFQATQIKKMAKEVYLCFDGDEAGAKATFSCSNELLALGVTPKIIRLEEGLDPDDYIKKYGKDKFLMKLDNPINIMDFKLFYYKQNRDMRDSEDLAHYVNDVVGELARIEDDVLREITLKKVSLEAGLDISFLRNRLTQIDTVTEKKEDGNKKEIVTTTKFDKAESYLLYYMLRSKEVIKLYKKKITYMPTERYRKLAREIVLFYEHYQDTMDAFIADFITYLEDRDDMIKTIGEIEKLHLKEDYQLLEITDYIDTINEYNRQYQIKRLQKRMMELSDPVEQAKIADEIRQIRLDNHE